MSGMQTWEEGVVHPPDPRGGARRGAGRPPGVKEVKPRNTERVTAPRVLTVQQEAQKWRAALKAAEDAGNIKEQREILQYINEMRRGKPYTATNPRERRAPAQDNRLYLAIQNLIPGGSSREPGDNARTPRKRRPSSTQKRLDK